MSHIIDSIHEKVCDLAIKHAEIIEANVKMVLERFNIEADKLILNYQADGSIEILIKCVHFKIENTFTFRELLEDVGELDG
jgi:hypothetical protein